MLKGKEIQLRDLEIKEKDLEITSKAQELQSTKKELHDLQEKFKLLLAKNGNAREEVGKLEHELESTREELKKYQGAVEMLARKKRRSTEERSRLLHKYFGITRLESSLETKGFCLVSLTRSNLVGVFSRGCLAVADLIESQLRLAPALRDDAWFNG